MQASVLGGRVESEMGERKDSRVSNNKKNLQSQATGRLWTLKQQDAVEHFQPKVCCEL